MKFQMLVIVNKKASKALSKAPNYIRDKLLVWVDTVQENGVESTRLIPGNHDKPLAGNRKGQRSVRLNMLWRPIYVESDNQIILTIIEVTPHDY